MKVVRFLERKLVIQSFGLILIVAPFINLFLHIYFIKKEAAQSWAVFQVMPILKQTSNLSIFLAVCSVLIGVTLLSGAPKAWRYVLFFLGSHLALQILNINDRAWKGPLAWPSFILNAGLFFFIFDQLVWKVKTGGMTEMTAAVPFQSPAKTVINLKSYRKVLFAFSSPQPWGEMKTLSSEFITVKSFAAPPANFDTRVVQISFTRDVVVDIQFSHQEADVYYFKPLNMDKEKVTKLNKWLRKIAV
jgi:hypothetical protein